MTIGIITGNVKAMGLIELSIDPASASANSSSETTVAVPGLEVGDFVAVNKPTLEAGLGIANVRVSAANTLAVQFINTTAAAINEVAETYVILWARRDGEIIGQAQG